MFPPRDLQKRGWPGHRRQHQEQLAPLSALTISEGTLGLVTEFFFSDLVWPGNKLLARLPTLSLFIGFWVFFASGVRVNEYQTDSSRKRYLHSKVCWVAY